MKKIFYTLTLLAAVSQPAYTMHQLSPHNINHKDSNDQTPLHYAVASGDACIVESLFSRFPNIDVNACNKDGTSIFELSVLVGSPEIMSLILEHPAFIIEPNELGRCLRHALYAIKNNEDKEHIKKQCIQIAQILIKHEKTNVNYQGRYNKFTPLMVAIGIKYFSLAQELVERTDLNLLLHDARGHTVLDWAVDTIENYLLGGRGATAQTAAVATLILRHASIKHLNTNSAKL